MDKNISDRAPRGTVQSVSRAILVLRTLSSSRTPLTIKEIVDEVGLDRTIVYRLLKTLSIEKLVVIDRNRFTIGPGVVLWANSYQDNLLVRRVALPYMIDFQNSLDQDKNWSISLSIPVGSMIAVVERVWTSRPSLNMILDLPDAFPIQNTSVGLCIIAQLDRNDVLEIVDEATLESIEPSLAEIRAQGVHTGTNQNGGQIIGVAISNRRGQPVAGIGLVADQFDSELSGDSPVAQRLLRTASAIGQALP